eukprot:4705172-Pyramimonas_sp.AAC.1
MHCVASGIIYVADEITQTSDMIGPHQTIRPDIVAAFEAIDRCSSEALAFMEQNPSVLEAGLRVPVPWIWGLTGTEQWFSAARALIQELRALAFGALIAEVVTFAKLVEKHVPKYDHFCNDAKVVMPLVRKNLVNNAKVDSLGKEMLD